MGPKTPNDGDQEEFKQIAEILALEDSTLNHMGRSKIKNSEVLNRNLALRLSKCSDPGLLSGLYQAIDGRVRELAMEVAHAAQESLDSGEDGPADYTPRDAWEDLGEDMQGLALAMDAARDKHRNSASDRFLAKDSMVESLMTGLDDGSGYGGSRSEESLYKKLEESLDNEDMQVKIVVKEE